VTADTRHIPDELGMFDILVTSPPYMPASSGRESYAKARAPSLIALGMRRHDDVDLLVDESIGSMEGNGVDLALLRPEERTIVIELRPGTRTTELLEELESRNAHVEYFQLQDEHERRIVTLTLDTPSEQLLAELGDLEFVQAVQWRR